MDVDETSLSPAQSRGARAMLGWSQAALAKAASIAQQTVVDFERGARTPYRNNLAAIRRTLEAAGIEFLPDNGVRLKVKAERSTRH